MQSKWLVFPHLREDKLISLTVRNFFMGSNQRAFVPACVRFSNNRLQLLSRQDWAIPTAPPTCKLGIFSKAAGEKATGKKRIAPFLFPQCFIN